MNIHKSTAPLGANYNLAALFALSLRLVTGWTYFSAFWRRLVLENKLDPESAGYIGEKFNHFLPNALLIKPMIEYLVSNPDTLWWAMAVFTIIEGIVGLLFMFGLFTRLTSIGVIGLAMGILLGAGWLGTTCLDEWQIGILGIAAGFTVLLAGGGKVSLDGWLMQRKPSLQNNKWFAWLASGRLPLSDVALSRIAIGGAAGILFLTLFTNQYFHGGVWGTLHNKSVKPKLELSNAKLDAQQLTFTVMRVEGVDVYGSFLIGVSLLDDEGNEVLELDGEALSQLQPSNISNHYVAKVTPGKHSLIIPLGAKAEMSLLLPKTANLGKPHKLVLTDISGTTWEFPIKPE